MPDPIPTALRARVRLLRKANETEQAMSGLCERGAVVMFAVAAAYREAANIYATDPTLENCPAGRMRHLDLAEELCRHIPGLVRSATTGRQADRWPIEDRWEEAEALTGRLPAILADARAQARPDHDTQEGSRAISRMWLVASSQKIRKAGETLSEALSKARSVPYPDPEIAELEALAAEIIERAQVLDLQPLLDKLKSGVLVQHRVAQENGEAGHG